MFEVFEDVSKGKYERIAADNISESIEDENKKLVVAEIKGYLYFYLLSSLHAVFKNNFLNLCLIYDKRKIEKCL